MITNGPIVANSLFIIVALLTLSTMDARHWPDFSCHAFKKTPIQGNSIIFYRKGWNSCKYSHEHYKQECDKMCVLRKRDVVIKSKKDDPFRFEIEAFITLMLNELGYEDEHRNEAPQKLVDEVTAKLEICKSTYRDFETMTNVQYLPCKPYLGLFQCVHNATGCGGNDTLLSY